MPVSPPVVFNPPMPEQLPEPPSEINVTTPATLKGRLGPKRKNPIVEHYNQVARGGIAQYKTNSLRLPHAVTPRSNNSKNFFH